MIRTTLDWTLLLTLFLVGSTPLAVAADAAPKGQNVFAGERLQVEIPFERPGEGKVVWSLSAGRAGAVIRRGEQVHTGPKPVVLTLDFPEVTPGVVLPATLALEFRTAAGVRREIREYLVFPRQLDGQKQAWLKSLALEIFDADGEWSALLESTGIAYRQGREADARSGPSGIQIRAVSGSSAQRTSAWRRAIAAAQSGRQVLLLGGAEAVVAKSEFAESLPQVENVTWMRNGLIRECDPRLDDKNWRQPGVLNACSAHESVRQGQAVIEFHDDATGWSALEVRYQTGGRLLWVGYGIRESWEATPAARYLFLGLLKRLSGPNHEGVSHAVE